MKLISAIIQPQKLSQVREALVVVGIDALIVDEVQRYGSHEDHVEYFRGAEYDVGFMPKIKIEFVTSDDKWQEIVNVIRDTAASGKAGDGRIFVSNIEHSIQIRSGKMDKETAVL